MYKWGNYKDCSFSACVYCYEDIIKQFSDSVTIDQYYGNCDTLQHYHYDSQGNNMPYVKIGYLLAKSNLSKWKFTNSARLRILRLFKAHFGIEEEDQLP